MGTMTIWDHIGEFAKRLKVMIIAFALASIIGFLPADLQGFSDPIHGGYRPLVSLLMLRMRHDFLPSNATLIASGLVDTLFVYMYLTLLIATVLSSPVIGYELYAFLKPALYANERKYLLRFMGSFVGLFVLGLAIAYYVIIPITFQILVWFIVSGGAVPFIGIKDFYNWILVLLSASGIFYTVPVFMVLLVQFGVFSAKVISGRTKIFVYFGLFMIIWTFGPDPTPITSTIIMVPFALIFEVALYVARGIDRNRAKTSTMDNAPSLRTRLNTVRCKFCNNPMASGSSFCPSCNKSQI
jgi:sec-independent protein translocase protein TatC